MQLRLGILGLLLASAASLMAGSAVAGDVGGADAATKDGAAAPANDWSGFYAGIAGGFGNSDSTKDITNFDAAAAGSGDHSKAEGGSESGNGFQLGQPKITVYGTIDAGMAYRSK